MGDRQSAVPEPSGAALEISPRVRRAGVVMQRRPLASRWQAVAWLPVRLENATGLTKPCLIPDGQGREEWLHPELPVELFRDEAEGYYLNLSAPAPAVFVHWSEENETIRILGLTVSYHEAARLMDGSMQVDPVPLPADWWDWLGAFTHVHYKPEAAAPRSRPPSFRGARRDRRGHDDGRDV